MSPGRRWILPLGVILAIILPFVLVGDRIEAAALGWAEAAPRSTLATGIVLLLGADVLLPVPSSVLSLFAGGVLGIVPGAIAIWLGMTLGCAMGWLVGRGALAPLEHRIAAPQGPHPETHWAALVLARPVPVLAEASVLLAAARGMALPRLLLVTGLANCPIAVLYGYFGARFLGNVPVWAMLTALAALTVVGLLVPRLRAMA